MAGKPRTTDCPWSSLASIAQERLKVLTRAESSLNISREKKGDTQEASGRDTCSAADFYGNNERSMKTSDGKIIQPTGKSFHVEFCTVATWNNRGEITEEQLFYDRVVLIKQIGLM